MYVWGRLWSTAIRRLSSSIILETRPVVGSSKTSKSRKPLYLYGSTYIQQRLNRELGERWLRYESKERFYQIIIGQVELENHENEIISIEIH